MMKKLVLLIWIILGCQAVIAQSIDEEKMNRDLEVTKNILATLMKSDSEMFFEGRNLVADYVEGYGVIITIPRHFMYFHIPPPKIAGPNIRIEGLGKGKAFIVTSEDDEETIKEKKQAMEEAREAEEEAMAELETEVKEYEKEIEAEMENWGENVMEQHEKFEEAMITFLADYADLIGQLKPEDKILINQESPYKVYNFAWVGPGKSTEKPEISNLSMEVSKKDISAFKGGEISIEEFKNRINIRTKEPEEKRADLEMFASIFKQYYSPKLTRTYFTEGTPTYEVLDNFGAIFRIKTYSSYAEGKLFYMPVLGEGKVDSEERKSTIEKLYPEFENDIKNFVIDYGRTIRSLEDDDMLVLKISMTRCEDCSIPKSMEVMVKMDVLKQFDQQKLSREKALAAITVKKDFNGSND
ncbi:MAG: hypothetical protein KFF73_20590 [Cyclobacteriaceae bacterium]|nr:hypothetical protein [Cyclobacteriaceae bacterium]